MSAVPALLLCSAVSASVEGWVWDFSHVRYYGTAVDASDGYDSHDQLSNPTAPIRSGVYHTQGVHGWTGPTGFYWRDIRAPLPMIVGTSKTWRIYLWADPTLSPERTTIGMSWFGTGVSAEALEQIEFRLTYVRRAVGVTDDWNVEGDYRILNDWPDGGSWAVPAIRIDNGLDGYVFELKATVIPEPSALIALGVGLAALGLRRRRSGASRDTDVPRNPGGGHG